MSDKIRLKQVSPEGNKEIIVQHGDYEAIRGKLFNDICTLPHWFCYWCDSVKARYTLRTDWTYRKD